MVLPILDYIYHMVMNMFGKIVLAAAAVSSAMVTSAFAAGKVACVGG